MAATNENASEGITLTPVGTVLQVNKSEEDRKYILNNSLIVFLTGAPGVGKTTAARYLEAVHGFTYISAEPKNMQDTRNELRKLVKWSELTHNSATANFTRQLATDFYNYQEGTVTCGDHQLIETALSKLFDCNKPFKAVIDDWRWPEELDAVSYYEVKYLTIRITGPARGLEYLNDMNYTKYVDNLDVDVPVSNKYDLAHFITMLGFIISTEPTQETYAARTKKYSMKKNMDNVLDELLQKKQIA